MYAVMSNHGHDQNALPPPLKLPSLAASGSDQPLRGVTAGIYWEVRPLAQLSRRLPSIAFLLLFSIASMPCEPTTEVLTCPPAVV